MGNDPTEEFGTLVDRLKGFSDHMESLLDRHSLRELHSMQTKSNLLLLQLTEQVTQLHVLAQNFNHKPTTSAWTLSRSTTLSSEVIEDDDFSRLINFKAQNLAMNEDDHDVDLFIPTATLTWQGEVSFLDRTVAHLNGSPVWIEWRQTSDRLDDTYRDIVTSRMSKLAYLLGDDKPPAGFRTPRCLGYCHMEADEEAYGLVYEDSLKSSPQTAPRSLRDLFAERSTPSLSARMSLALQLTESLMYLHAVNWLHKGFSSANILFPQSSAAKTGRLEDPTISGFDFSRPDADETTIKSITRAQDDYYKSPALLQGHSSTKADDIYALGVVLIEIALWKPVEDIVEGSTGKKLSRSQIYFIRERLLSEGIEKHQGILDDVAAAAGDRYASVARRCRQGAEELGLPTDRSKARGPEVDSSLQAVFYDEIIHGFEGSPGVVCIELGLSYTVVERQIDVNDHYVVSYSFDKSTGH